MKIVCQRCTKWLRVHTLDGEKILGRSYLTFDEFHTKTHLLRREYLVKIFLFQKQGDDDFDPNQCYHVERENSGLTFYGNKINFPKPADAVKKLKNTGISLLLGLIGPNTLIKNLWDNEIIKPLSPNSAVGIMEYTAKFKDAASVVKKTSQLIFSRYTYIRIIRIYVLKDAPQVVNTFICTPQKLQMALSF